MRTFWLVATFVGATLMPTISKAAWLTCESKATGFTLLIESEPKSTGAGIEVRNANGKLLGNKAIAKGGEASFVEGSAGYSGDTSTVPVSFLFNKVHGSPADGIVFGRDWETSKLWSYRFRIVKSLHLRLELLGSEYGRMYCRS